MKIRRLLGIAAAAGSLFAGGGADGQDGKRHPIYPFDVKVGGELAVLEGSGDAAIFARAKSPVKNDAVVDLGIEPDMVIVNVFPTNEKGELPGGVQPQPAVIMNSKTTSFSLDATMDQKKLEPGFYLMNIVAQKLGTSRVVFQIGDGKAAPEGEMAAIDQSKPENVLQAVFDVAKSGEFEMLRALKSSKADGDVKEICAVADADAEEKAGFKEYFSKGKIVGSPKIEGDKAAIDFLFGPNGTRPETMNLAKEGGKWFMDSF